nr:ets variant gene 4 [Hymenolepis microstoma]
MIEFREGQDYNWKDSKDSYSSCNCKNTVESFLPTSNLRMQGHRHGHSHHNQDHRQHHQSQSQQQNQSQQKGSLQLWRFLVTMLDDPASQHLICWAGRKLEFKLNEPEEVARLWGIQKNRPTMNYDKLSRSLRYYYEKGIISKVSGERYVYRFVYEPEVLAKLTLDDNLGSVAPSKPKKICQPMMTATQEVIFPSPPSQQIISSPQICQTAIQTITPFPQPSISPSQPNQTQPQLFPLQEMVYQPQWEEQVIYPANYEYEWSDTYGSTNVQVSYPVNQHYDYSYSYDHADQVYCTDINTDNYALFECSDYF